MCSPTPVFIGFGLKSKADIDILDHETCDGHIIGSAYIQKIENGQGKQFLKELIIK
jgi:tryptophan synthase alpha subunit